MRRTDTRNRALKSTGGRIGVEHRAIHTAVKCHDVAGNENGEGNEYDKDLRRLHVRKSILHTGTRFPQQAW